MRFIGGHKFPSKPGALSHCFKNFQGLVFIQLRVDHSSVEFAPELLTSGILDFNRYPRNNHTHSKRRRSEILESSQKNEMENKLCMINITLLLNVWQTLCIFTIFSNSFKRGEQQVAKLLSAKAYLKSCFLLSNWAGS